MAHEAVENSYQFQDMFSLRMRASQAERRIAAADLAATQASSAEARGAVVAARTAAEAVQTLIDERLVAAEADHGFIWVSASQLRSNEPLRVVWEYSRDEATAALTSEFMALGNHRPSIRAVIADVTEQIRRAQLAALAGLGDTTR